RWVLRGVDLAVSRGEAVALMGRNGSGKTTLLRVIATLLRATRGSGRVWELDLTREASTIREVLGWLGHHPGLYDDLTAAENLRFSQRMAGLPFQPAAVHSVLERVGLWAERDERVRSFSAGMRRRLALARVMLRPPRVLLLDEPYAAFDPEGVELVNRFAREIARSGGCAIVVTHDYARAKPAVDRVFHIEDGRVFSGLDPTLSPDDHVTAPETAG
ncbi:MAG: heme ABC exporter ATP-binding protein CcmA, partial [Longimicrobiales bacterium]